MARIFSKAMAFAYQVQGRRCFAGGILKKIFKIFDIG
jgi:hypothetical protein